MLRVLIVHHSSKAASVCTHELERAGFKVLTATFGPEDVASAARERVDLIEGAAWEPSLSGDDLLRVVRTAFGRVKTEHAAAAAPVAPDGEIRLAAHASRRWARAVKTVLHAREDPRTLTGWARLVSASPGALRSWCRTAGIAPRKTLVFARLLRAVLARQTRAQRLEDLIDVAERRTLTGWLCHAGFGATASLPATVEEFLRHQTLVRNPQALLGIQHVLPYDRRHTTP